MLDLHFGNTYVVGTLFVQFDADYFLAALSNLEDDKR